MLGREAFGETTNNASSHTHPHKPEPPNHFTVAPHLLSPLLFNWLWAQFALDSVLRSRGFDISHGCAPGGGWRNLKERQFRFLFLKSLAPRSWGECGTGDFQLSRPVTPVMWRGWFLTSQHAPSREQWMSGMDGTKGHIAPNFKVAHNGSQRVDALIDVPGASVSGHVCEPEPLSCRPCGIIRPYLLPQSRG